MKFPCMLVFACTAFLFELASCKSDGSTATLTNGGGGSEGVTAGSGGNRSGGIAPTGGSPGSGGTMPTRGGSGSGGAVPTGGSPGSDGPSSPKATGGNAGSNGGAGATKTSSNATGGAAGSDGGTAGITGTGGTSAMGLTLYYIRHAEVVANTADAGSVSTDTADTLTELGQRQIAALSTYLQGLSITPDAVLVSPAPRAQKTIEPYLVVNDLTGEIWIDLNEASNASSTAAPLPAAPVYYTYYKASIVAQNLVFRDPAATNYWQNDTYEAGVLMVTTAKSEILARYGQSGKTIVVVGHAIAGQIMIGLLLGQDMLSGPTSTGPTAVYLLNTGIMKLVQDPTSGAFKLEGRNINNPPTK